MRTIMNGRGMLIALALLAAAGLSACSANRTPNRAVADNGQTATTTTPAATGAATEPASTPAAAVPSAAPAGSRGVQNLLISNTEKNELTAAYLAFRGGIPLSDVAGEGPTPGSVYYAYNPASDTYYALADFEPSTTASLDVQVGFQDGGGVAMYRKVGEGAWQLGNPGVPFFCGEVKFFPQAVLMAWSMSTTAPAGLVC